MQKILEKRIGGNSIVIKSARPDKISDRFLDMLNSGGYTTIIGNCISKLNAKKRRVHKDDINRESGVLRTENEGLMEYCLGALGVSDS